MIWKGNAPENEKIDGNHLESRGIRMARNLSRERGEKMREKIRKIRKFK